MGIVLDRLSSIDERTGGSRVDQVRPRRRRRSRAGVTAAFAVVLVSGCGSDHESRDNLTADATTSRTGAGSTLDVVASFYPLQFVVERVGGGRVMVENLTA